MIGKINEELNKPVPSILKAIDIVTGYSEKDIRDKKMQLITLLEIVVRCKKLIEADYSADEKLIYKIKSITHEKTKQHSSNCT